MRKFLPLLVISALLSAAVPVLAATNISATPSEHYTWNDVAGWMNFYSTDEVTVTNSKIEGYASSSAGELSLDCATTSIGNICGSSDYSVTNDGTGTLAGYGWLDTYGWVSFNCTNHAGCGTSNYSVNISPTTGIFSGYAWNDILGWISFNCADIAICGISDYKVVTSWTATSTSGTLDSAVIDTGVVSGAQVNGVTWVGDRPSGTSVRIQIATSQSDSGPWNYYGSDGTASTYYTPESGVGAVLYPWAHAPGRYFRYRIILVSDSGDTLTPRVDDVVVRWSP